MAEIWKDIEEYEGLYQVSDQGRVRSLPRNTTSGKLLKPRINRYGYLYVVLCKGGKTKTYTIHRLVAMAFIPNDSPEQKTQINHKDECKTNNFIWINENGTMDPEKSNLEWVTSKENVNYGTRNRRSSQKHINHPDMSKPVKQLSLDGALVAIWPSIMEAARNGYNQGSVWSCCQGKYKTHKGYKWEYDN